MIFSVQTMHTVMHEEAHAQVAYCTGGYNCTTEVGFGYGATYCEDYGSPTLQALNEIIGYPIGTLATSIILGAMLIGMAILLNKEK